MIRRITLPTLSAAERATIAAQRAAAARSAELARLAAPRAPARQVTSPRYYVRIRTPLPELPPPGTLVSTRDLADLLGVRAYSPADWYRAGHITPAEVYENGRARSWDPRVVLAQLDKAGRLAPGVLTPAAA